MDRFEINDEEEDQTGQANCSIDNGTYGIKAEVKEEPPDEMFIVMTSAENVEEEEIEKTIKEEKEPLETELPSLPSISVDRTECALDDVFYPMKAEVKEEVEKELAEIKQELMDEEIGVNQSLPIPSSAHSTLASLPKKKLITVVRKIFTCSKCGVHFKLGSIYQKHVEKGCTVTKLEAPVKHEVSVKEEEMEAEKVWNVDEWMPSASCSQERKALQMNPAVPSWRVQNRLALADEGDGQLKEDSSKSGKFMCNSCGRRFMQQCDVERHLIEDCSGGSVVLLVGKRKLWEGHSMGAGCYLRNTTHLLKPETYCKLCPPPPNQKGYFFKCDVCKLKFSSTTAHQKHAREMHPSVITELLCKHEYCVMERRQAEAAASRRPVFYRPIFYPMNEQLRCEGCHMMLSSFTSMHCHHGAHADEFTCEYRCKGCGTTCTSPKLLQKHILVSVLANDHSCHGKAEIVYIRKGKPDNRDMVDWRHVEVYSERVVALSRVEDREEYVWNGHSLGRGCYFAEISQENVLPRAFYAPRGHSHTCLVCSTRCGTLDRMYDHVTEWHPTRLDARLCRHEYCAAKRAEAGVVNGRIAKFLSIFHPMDKLIKCIICSKWFDSFADLSGHFNIDHFKRYNLRFTCGGCGSKFGTHLQLREHIIKVTTAHESCCHGKARVEWTSRGR